MSYRFHKKLILRIPLISFQGTTQIKSKKQTEALFLASPNLYEEQQRTKGISKEEKERLNTALLKYATRMHTRCTPFGLFAGTSRCGFGIIIPTLPTRMQLG